MKTTKKPQKFFYRNTGQVALEVSHILTMSNTAAVALQDLDTFEMFYRRIVREMTELSMHLPADEEGARLFNDSFMRKERCFALFDTMYVDLSEGVLEEVYECCKETFELA